MLKKNLVRTSFLGHGLLLFIPNTGTIKGRQSQKEAVAIEGYQWLFKNRPSLDTVILRTDSSGRHLTEDEKLAAPKILLNKNAITYVKGFMKREKEALEKVSARGERYFPMIDSIFNQYGLPLELRYLAIVESYLKTNAVSKMGAKGMWQFMPVTARELGLRIKGKYDERTHAVKSTVAAAKYLRSLYKEFGDWLLVLAAYNGGPGTVYKAIKRSGSKNFWALQRFLPEESRGHVKRFIGTHFYFEGAGGVTTQTKAESIAYKKQLDQYLASLIKKEIESDSTKIATLNTVMQ